MAKVDELVAMGYSPKQAEQALAIAEGDLEQAVGFLMMEESGRINFEGVDAGVPSGIAAGAAPPLPRAAARAPVTTVPVTVTVPATAPTVVALDGGPIPPPRTRESVIRPGATKPGAYAVETDNVVEITNMGYSRAMAQEALHFSGGDLEQALNYLLLACRESVSNDSRAPWEAFRRSDSATAVLDADATMAARLQVEEMRAAARAAGMPPGTAVAAHGGRPTAPLLAHGVPALVSPLPESAMYHTTTLRNEADGPRMVSSQSFLNVDGAGPFCVCVTASRFLDGGVVTAAFLNEILQAGTELFRKTSNTDMNVTRVLQKYGKSTIGIEVDLTAAGGSTKSGVHLTKDHTHAMGIRKLLADCRNSQPAGWQALILEVGHSFEHICIGLPPKGSRNKFWYIDCRPRQSLGASGAHARVHSTLLQLTETLEATMTEPLYASGRCHETFRIHIVKKIKP